MIEVIICKGLPASGKSTWSKELVVANPDKYVRINKDDLREMLFCSIWNKMKEKMVVSIRDWVLVEALENNRSVIIDDTNLDPSHEKRIRDIVSTRFPKVQIRIKDFTEVPIDECIRRNALRAKPVPEHVIHDMHNKYIVPFKDKGFNAHTPYTPIEGLDEAIIIDLDGTLAINDGHRNWYEESKVYNDKVNEYLVKVINGLRNTHPMLKLIFVSGRKHECYEDTARFIRDKAKLPIWGLHMRPTLDTRKDAIVKIELYEEHIKGKYNIIAVFDDRPSVCEAWHKEGLPIFRLGHPTVDF